MQSGNAIAAQRGKHFNKINMNTVEFFSIIGVFVAIASVVVTVWIFRNEMKQQTKVTQMSFFAEYTKRYQEIVLNIPEDLDDEKKLNNEDVKRYLRVYFDLCSEEYFLHEEKYIKENVWKEWKEGMQVAFNKKAIRKYWQERKTPYKGFNKFVEEELISKDKKPNT